MAIQRGSQGSRKLNHGVTCCVFTVLLPLLFQLAAGQSGNVPYSGNNLGPTIDKNMAIVIIVLVCVFFVLGFVTVYARQCTDDSFGANIDFSAVMGRSIGRSRRAMRGLEPEVIATFPSFVYSTVKGHRIGKGSLECAVCISEFQDDETLRLLPKCSHVFHAECIDSWLAAHSTCPVCRANLVPEPNDISLAQILVSEPEANPDNGSRGPPTSEPENQEAPLSQPSIAEPPVVNLISSSQNRPPRSRSVGWQRRSGLFPRSHSTGHSLVQPGESHERFTLRLPDDVRSQLMNTTLDRARSCVVLPRMASSRRGYRGGGEGSGRGKRVSSGDGVDRSSGSGRWGFFMNPPFFGRSGSSRTPRVAGMGDTRGGERSSARLRADDGSQV